MTCRYGFPHQCFGRGESRKMRLVKGDRLGSWFARFPRNDALVCSTEAHFLLANLGNVDWRPCLNLWAVVEYVTKYATKAAKGSRRLNVVLQEAVDSVCKWTADGEGTDLLRKSLQKFYSKTLGERDYGIFEAVHLGLNLPLVLSLMDMVTLNTSGSRSLKSEERLQKEGPDAPVEWLSKVDKFDQRRELLWQMKSDLRKRKGKEEEVLSFNDINHVSLYEFYWKHRFWRCFYGCSWKNK